VGDKLVAVDDVDVRNMTAVDVSKLISKKSGQAKRKLTIIRSARGRDGMY
jgi:C-terminal processing protease CtpA/Prc